ncbi:MAG: stage 0 sporulation protein [Chloroflexota bacterium]|nr:stage 0 sporulation protein [Chloroflexota bacterium]
MSAPARTVVGARVQQAGRMYFFDPGDTRDLAVGDVVIVETALGLDAARVHILPTDSPLVQVDAPLGRVLRRATATDKFLLAKHERLEEDARRIAAEMATMRDLPIRILGCDWSFDGAALTVFYASNERLELGAYADELGARFSTHVDLRRMGARDETKVTGGVGTCGRELCCATWLDRFSNISIRMAKEQDLPLNLSKLTGVCGRLKCCLIYELETYQEVKGKLPKEGDIFHMPSCVGGQCGTAGCAQVQGASVTKEAVIVGLADGGRAQVTAAELGVSFDPVPAHTKGVGAYGADEIPRQERATAMPGEGAGGGQRRRRRRRGRR